MKLILSASSYFRGLETPFSQQYHDGQHIIWITPDRDYASKYGVPQEFSANLNKGTSFGFRNLDVIVHASELGSRVRKSIMLAYNSRMCSKETAVSALKSLDPVLKRSEMRPAFEWYMKFPVFAQALRAVGYDYVEAQEANGVPTIGVLDPKRCTPVEAQ